MDAKDENGETSLLLAVETGQEALALALVKAGADKDAKNKAGRTPLHMAAEHGLEALALALVAAGADTEAKDSDGDKPETYPCPSPAP